MLLDVKCLLYNLFIAPNCFLLVDFALNGNKGSFFQLKLRVYFQVHLKVYLQFFEMQLIKTFHLPISFKTEVILAHPVSK